MQWPWQKTDKKQTTPDISLYTRTVDVGLVPVIYGIKGKHDEFATDFFRMGNENGESPQEAQIARCLKAWQNPHTKLWQVREWTYIPAAALPANDRKENGEGAFRVETSEYLNLCFFDALRLCAEFQLSQKKAGKAPLPAPNVQWKNIPNWQEAADAAKQARDMDGMVHPCANHEILVRNFSHFDEKAVALAAQSAKVEIPKNIGLPMPSQDSSAIDPMLAAMNNAGGTLLESARDKRQTVAAYENVIRCGEELEDATSWAYHRDFKDSFWREVCREIDSWGELGVAALLSIGTVGILPACLYYAAFHSAEPRIFPYRAFEKTSEAFNKAAANLPSAQDRAICEEFMKNAGFSFWMQRAKVEFEGQKNEGKSVETGFPFIEKAAAIKGLGSAETEQLKAEYLIDGFNGKSYRYAIKQAWKEKGPQPPIQREELWGLRTVSETVGLKEYLTRQKDKITL